MFDSQENPVIEANNNASDHPNGADSTGNTLNPVGTFSFNHPFILSAGQTATLNVTSSTGLSQVRTITPHSALQNVVLKNDKVCLFCDRS